MRFTERELTVALEGAAKSVLAAQDKTRAQGRRTADEAWDALTKFQRFQLLDGLGDQLLAAAGLAAGRGGGGRTRPTFTDAQIRAAVEERLGGVRGIKRKVLLEARVALVRMALETVPPRGPGRPDRAGPPLIPGLGIVPDVPADDTPWGVQTSGTTWTGRRTRDPRCG